MAQRRVLFLVPELAAVSCRFRVLQYVPHLRRLGVESDIVELRAPLFARLRAMARARAYAAVVVHRALLGPVERRWLRRAAPHYVFDFDDAISFRDSAARRFASRRRRRRFAGMVGGAGCVVAGNRYLAGLARAYTDRVAVIPTAVDLDEYAACASESAGAIVGWMGTRSNLTYLRQVLPALAALSERRSDVRLAVVSDGVLDGADVPLIQKRWTRAEEAGDLRGFQVGIMPLPDDPWTRGKCAVKILQYFAASVPVVCSPVGTNCEVVVDGENGYFAATPDEWVARLDALLGDARLRRRLGEHGRAVVEQRYAVHATLPALVEALGVG